ncbi:OmpA family protein [Thiomicrospira sp. ALE5]|uniref:OmpA/MotB family protein n=1 Tax=Thiomicrospira sp. ALE5 TaxID=748650 RepID=UPI0008E90202|nr:OmpA family protein [Thiomicrospira sp. ALE5]SFR52388.1 chemotaxis protein MotB [Thiomicrospira sp. ALE5]
MSKLSEKQALLQERVSLENYKKSRGWLFVFVGLFTVLLAFYVLIVALVEFEGVSAQRSFQKINHSLFLTLEETRAEQGWDHVEIENTLAKGIRIRFNTEIFEQVPLFLSARAEIEPGHIETMNQLVVLIEALELPFVRSRFSSWVASIEAAGYEFSMQVRVEGHTDGVPLTPGFLYRNNLELSTDRAFQVKDYLRASTGLPPELFAIAGYGDFRPDTDNPFDIENRRIEVFVTPLMTVNTVFNPL